MSDVLEGLSLLTGDLELLPVRQIVVETVGNQQIRTAGRYYLDEEELPDLLKSLLHGRVFVVDKETINVIDQSNPVTYYVSADITQGLIIPARSVSIGSEKGTIYYRWTDDGDKFTGWITLPDGAIDSYLQQEEVRFAEIQVYTNIPGTLVSIRGSR